jgi:hypothetical protein
VTDEAGILEHKGYRIRVLNWNGRYKAWISRAGVAKVISGFTAGAEISTEWHETHEAAVRAARAAIDSGEVK